MPQLVELPSGQRLEFPDGMTDADMDKAIRRNFYNSPSEENKAFAAEQKRLREKGEGGTAMKVWETVEGITQKLNNPIGAILEFPEHLARSLGADVPYTSKSPLVPPEAMKEAVEFMTPGGAASEDSTGQAVQEFIAETASGLTSPDMIGYMALGGKYPKPVGRYFQGEMLTHLPQSVRAVAEAEPGKEQTKAALAVVANVAFPALIERGVVKADTKAPIDLEPQVKRITELRAPEGTPRAGVKEAQTEVSTVAATEGKRTAEEIKDDLITSIQERLQQASSDPKPGEKVTIEIPGDGTFTVPNTVEHLSELLARAKKIKTDAGKAPGVPKAALKVQPKLKEATAGVEAMEQAPVERITELQAPTPTLDEPTLDLASPEAVEASKGGIPMPKSLDPLPGTEPIKASDIIRDMADLIDRPIRVGHIAERTALGIYKPKLEVARLRRANDLPVASHEIAHALEQAHRRTIGKGTDIGRHAWTMKMPADVRAELKSLDYDPTKKRPFEGFAEFTRHWLTGSADTAVTAPHAHKWFTETFLTHDQRISEGLHAIREKITRFREQGSVNRVESLIRFEEPKPTIGERIGAVKRKFVRLFVDDLAPVEAAEKEVTGGSLAFGADSPTKIARTVTQASGTRAREWAKHSMTDFAGNPTGPGLREIFGRKGIAGNEKPAITYAVARRTTELHGRGIDPGIDLADAQHTVKQLYTAERERFADEIARWNEGALKYLADAGGISPDTLKKITSQNEFYVPLFRVFDEQLGSRSSGGGRRIGDTPQPIKRIKGSGRDIVNPVEAMQTHAAQIISVADKVRTSRALVELVEKGQGFGKYVEEIPATKIPVEFDLNRIKKQLEGLGIDLSEAELDAVLTLFQNSPRNPAGPNIVSFVKEGKRHFYELHPELYRALQSLDYQRIHPILDLIFGKPTRAIRLGATGVRAGFTLWTNPVRDFATMLLQSRGNPIEAAGQWGKHMAKQIGFKDNEVKNLWRATGGELGQPLGMDRASLRRAVDDVLNNTAKQKALNVVKHPVEFVRAALSWAEAAPRLAEFESTLRKTGWKPGQPITESAAIEAAHRSAEVTVDFKRAGTHARWINQMVAFFNPSIQGLSKFARSHTDAKIASVLRGTTLITLPALLNWWMNRNDDEWRNFPAWLKYGFLNFKVGGEWVRVPTPFEWWYAYGAVPIATAETLYRERPYEMTLMFQQAFKQMTPPVLPSVAKPILEADRNESFLTGKPIVPQSLEELPAQEQALPYTSTTARKVAEILGAGGLEVAPARVEHVLNGETGGIWSDLVNTAELLTGTAPPREMLEPADMPVFGRIFVRDGSSVLIDDFYSQYEFLQGKKATFRKLLAENSPGAAKYELTQGQYGQLAAMDKIAKAMTALRKQYRESTTREERNEIWKEMTELAKFGLETEAQ